MTVSSTSLMDGIGRHILTMAPALNARDGVEVAVMTLWPKGELNAALEAKGVKTYSLNAPNGHSLPVLWRTCRIMREFGPDIVHHHVMPLLTAVALKWLCCGFKIVLTRHGIPDPAPDLPAWRRTLGKLWLLAGLHYDAVCYVSRGVMKGLEHLPEAKGNLHRVVYNPLAFDRAASDPSPDIRELISAPPDAPVIGTACRLAAVKNLSAFVDVAERVLRRHAAAHAVLLGEGDESVTAGLRQMKRALPEAIGSRLHFLGYRPDANGLVGSFSCFVMTSFREGMPTALLEAIVAKTPVAFFTGEGGLGDLAEMNAGAAPWAVVAGQGDADGLAKGISRLLEDRELSRDCAERAWEACSREFSLERAVTELVEVYAKVLK